MCAERLHVDCLSARTIFEFSLCLPMLRFVTTAVMQRGHFAAVTPCALSSGYLQRYLSSSVDKPGTSSVDISTQGTSTMTAATAALGGTELDSSLEASSIPASQYVRFDSTTSRSTGYAETMFHDSESQKYGELLRIPLKEVRQKTHEEKKQENGAADVYAAQTVAQPTGQVDEFLYLRVNKQASFTFNKLVGVMTKDGHKSKARKILLNALHVIRKHLQAGTTEKLEQRLSKSFSYFDKRPPKVRVRK